jgi:hypothetical protein
MGLLERYAQQATLLRRSRSDREVLTDIDLLRDTQVLGGETQREWKPWMQDIAASGDPMGLAGGIAGAEVTPPPGTLATVTIGATELALWPTVTWTPIAANPQAPKAYMLYAFGTATTAATPGTMLFNARFGQIVTSPLIGVSTAAAQTASQTATPWMLMGRIVIQRGGPATSGLVVANFKYEQGTAVSGGSTVLPAIEQIFGTTTGAVSVVTDGSVAAGLWVGAIAATSTTNTFIPQSVIWMSYN